MHYTTTKQLETGEGLGAHNAHKNAGVIKENELPRQTVPQILGAESPALQVPLAKVQPHMDTRKKYQGYERGLSVHSET